MKVYYGPRGYGNECHVSVATDKVLTCTLDGAPMLGQAQKFVVVVGSAQSDVSDATYTPLGAATVVGHRLDDAPDAGDFDGGIVDAGPLDAQVHVWGEGFTGPGGEVPTVFFAPVAPAAGDPLICGNVLLISPRELFCYVRRDRYPGRAPTVIRAGEDAP